MHSYDLNNISDKCNTLSKPAVMEGKETTFTIFSAFSSLAINWLAIPHPPKGQLQLVQM